MPKQPFSEIADNPDLHKLADLLRGHRAELLAIRRREVRRLPAARDLDVPTVNDHVPNVLEDLAAPWFREKRHR
jgi:hypothetical protein